MAVSAADKLAALRETALVPPLEVYLGSSLCEVSDRPGDPLGGDFYTADFYGPRHQETAALACVLLNAAPALEALIRAAERHAENCEAPSGRCGLCDSLADLDKALQ